MESGAPEVAAVQDAEGPGGKIETEAQVQPAEVGMETETPTRGPDGMYPMAETQALEQDPEPEGSGQGQADEAGSSKRFELFSVAMETMVQKLLEAASFERFAQCYSPVHEILPQFTHSVHKQFVAQLQTSIQEEIKQISEDGLFERALPKLDQLEREAEARTVPAWRPTGTPAEDLRAHLVPCQLQQRQYLQLKLRKAQEENAALTRDVLQGRKRLENLRQLRDDRLQDWQECNRICQKFKLSSP
ncbi:polyamine-modulated factor 1 [Hypanus sabinus]|uniref:polyamine-modulated factor 1 n=1 Tax=Hypanus sabinus TaxID=79690 RepID=UPI0028C383DC|nr:polyamine-modulated factor 1 [Hypanus sabinus]